MKTVTCWDRLTEAFAWFLDGPGGKPDRLAKCAPGVCFQQSMCIETERGFECAPCPEGYTGDGVRCDDVNEVRIYSITESFIYELLKESEYIFSFSIAFHSKQFVFCFKKHS